MIDGLRALKGHGTENDFVLIPDFQARLSVSSSLVRSLCDRHAGIGADGLLRIVRTENATEPEVRALASQAPFFMDYRNADGSIAEMCGNGVRVFARYLQQHGHAGDHLAVATRGGIKQVTFEGSDVVVEMGRPQLRLETPIVAGQWKSRAIDMPNPHVVVELADLRELDALDLSLPPAVEPALPEGQNVEFFVRTGDRQVQMRVHERGVGETRSCGTGICAVAVAAAGADLTGSWQVDVPGGRCTVRWTDSGMITLAGPAELVAEVEISETWLQAHR